MTPINTDNTDNEKKKISALSVLIRAISGSLCFHSRLFARIRGPWEFCVISGSLGKSYPRNPKTSAPSAVSCDKFVSVRLASGY
jgi:hypothetical protein